MQLPEPVSQFGEPLFQGQNLPVLPGDHVIEILDEIFLEGQAAFQFSQSFIPWIVHALPGGLPQFDPVAIRIDKPAETAEIVFLAFGQYLCAPRGYVVQSGIEIIDNQVDHMILA